MLALLVTSGAKFNRQMAQGFNTAAEVESRQTIGFEKATFKKGLIDPKPR